MNQNLADSHPDVRCVTVPYRIGDEVTVQDEISVGRGNRFRSRKEGRGKGDRKGGLYAT